ncbi:MAG: hypothetical protein AB9861_10015 [Methanosarcina sp.]|jgi:hypothetical protein
MCQANLEPAGHSNKNKSLAWLEKLKFSMLTVKLEMLISRVMDDNRITALQIPGSKSGTICFFTLF